MPVLKVKVENTTQYIDIPFYHLTFKNDIIKTIYKEQVYLYPIKKAEYGYYTASNAAVYRLYSFTSEYNIVDQGSQFYLYKRPLLNWLKYLYVLITKKYFYP